MTIEEEVPIAPPLPDIEPYVPDEYEVFAAEAKQLASRANELRQLYIATDDTRFRKLDALHTVLNML